MTSTTSLPPRATPAQLSACVVEAEEAAQRASACVAGDAAVDVAALPPGVAEAHARDLLAAADRLTAAATTLLGAVDAAPGRLVGGTHVSVGRFLEAEAGMSRSGAAAVVARARDLRDDLPDVGLAWLAGRLSGDAVREVAVGLRRVLVRVPDQDRDEVRARVLAVLLPLAETGTVAQLRTAIRRLVLLLDPDGTSQEALDAASSQSLSCVQVDALTRIEVWLTPENAATVMTVLEQVVAGKHRAGDLTPHEVLPAGIEPESAAGRRLLRSRRSRGLAEALAETMRSLLDAGQVGDHHAVAPHVTLTVDLDHLAGPLPELLASALPIGEVAMPGQDEPALVGAESVRRILCDSSLTTVVTRPADHDAADHRAAGHEVPDYDPVLRALTEHAREVLWLARAVRTVTFRQRRALEARDRHCAFPGCRAHVRRCRAHHVVPWEQGGGSDPDNLVLLCESHHHAVHEGGWTVRRAGGPLRSGAFAFHPPDPRRP